MNHRTEIPGRDAGRSAIPDGTLAVTIGLFGALSVLIAALAAAYGDEDRNTVAPVFERARTDGGYVIVPFSEEITVSPQVAYAIQLYDVPI